MGRFQKGGCNKFSQMCQIGPIRVKNDHWGILSVFEGSEGLKVCGPRMRASRKIKVEDGVCGNDWRRDVHSVENGKEEESKDSRRGFGFEQEEEYIFLGSWRKEGGKCSYISKSEHGYQLTDDLWQLQMITAFSAK